MRYHAIELTGLSSFGESTIIRMGNPWCVQKITDHLLFSTHPGPWMLIEREHFQRWVNLSADANFSIRWKGWLQ